MIYVVSVTREGRDWLATVTNLEGVSTWATTFSQLDRNVREAIALAEDLPEGAEGSLCITWEIPASSSEVEEALKVSAERRRLVQAQKDLEAQVAGAIAVFTKNNWSTRDQAALFGMTAGRISQIANRT